MSENDQNKEELEKALHVPYHQLSYLVHEQCEKWFSPLDDLELCQHLTRPYLPGMMPEASARKIPFPGVSGALPKAAPSVKFVNK